MNGLGSKTYYNKDGIDWLRTIVRSVYTYTTKGGAVLVVSMAAVRAQRLYYKKTDIKILYRSKYHG